MENFEKRLVSKLVEVKALFDSLLNEVIILKSLGQVNSKEIKDLYGRIKAVEGQINTLLEGIKVTTVKPKTPIITGWSFSMLVILFLALKDYITWGFKMLRYYLTRLLD